MSRDLTLWLSALTGPVVWFLNLEANFALAPLADAPAVRLAILLISLAALILTAVACWISWTGWRNARANEPASRRALSVGGFALNGLFAAVIIAQAIPSVMLSAHE